MSDVPTVVEFARTDEQRQVLRAVMNATEIGTAFFTTPGAPADRVEALRRAFDATMKDPEFLAEAERTKLTVGPLPGEELQKLVNEVTSLSPEMIEKVKAAIRRAEIDASGRHGHTAAIASISSRKFGLASPRRMHSVLPGGCLPK